MKKLFKKSIACLIAVLMVVSTMPFTAITAQAADTSALLSAMQAFEAKMDGSVYTNMDTAYTAYVAASKAYDAAYYGGDASVDVSTPATNLNNAVSQMTKTTLTVYTANNSTVPTFTDGDNGTVANSYVNLLYTGTGTQATAEVENKDAIRYTFQVGYNNTVMMYDGTAPRTRVMYMCRVPGKANGKDKKRNPMSCYPTTGSGKSDDLGSLYLVDKWKGGYNDDWNYPTQYNSGTYTFGHNSSTASAGRQIGSSWSGANPSKWFGYSNILEFNSNYNWNGSYLASFANVWWANWSGDNKKADLLTDDSSTSIYVINYKPLKDAITADANSEARKNVASYKEGGMSTYLAGCLSAASLNPNSYDYTNDFAGQASKCASDISTAVTKFKTAPTADNTENYPKLRSAFDYSGALTGFNNATYSVREAYNGGVNNGFTQASYKDFKEKYEAAQNVMKAVAETGYVNDGFAGDAATALTTAFNALQHEHSFTGAYVNNKDGTHSQKCAFYDKCATLSDSAAHSFTNYTVTNAATCSETGTKVATCDRCNATDTQTIEKNPNNHTGLTTIPAKASTCTEAGWEEYTYCEDCKKVVGEKVDLELAKHEYVVTSKDDDKHTLTCQNCQNTYDEAHKWGEYAVTIPATCTKNAVETATCTVEGCGATTSKEVADSALGHTWSEWAPNGDGTHTKTCTKNCGEEGATVTAKCSYVDGVCTECKDVEVKIDWSSYDVAVKEYNEIKSDPDYETMYSEKSITDYEKLVNEVIANKDTLKTQEDVDAAAAAIISAKVKLVYVNFDIDFYVVDKYGYKTFVETKNADYGDPVTFTKDADNIAKWIVTTQKGNVETKVAISQTTYTMIATEPATVYVYLTEEKTEALEYSKVSFIGKNGAVSFVKYVEKGETINTIDVPGVEIPFYKFMNWDKASVTADGSDIEVKAVYKFVGTEDDKCNVHYNDTTKTYTYDSFVYLFGAEGKKLALATDAEGKDIITYLNENAFYAPHTKDIYVIEVIDVDSQQASIGITGSYMQSNNDGTKTAAFNCKFYVPDATYDVVEYGMIATSSKGSMKIKAEKASDRGEYCIKISSKEVKSISGQAYLTYRTSEGKFETIYSTTTVTQNLR